MLRHLRSALGASGLVLVASTGMACAPTPQGSPGSSATTGPSPAVAGITAVASPNAAPPSPAASPIASPAPDQVAPKPANASLAIVEPAAGAPVAAGSVTVRVDYSGPTLVPAASATAIDQYHLHYFLDVNSAQYIGTTTPAPLGNPNIVHTAATTVTFDNVAPGTHQLAVALSGSNHVSVSPPLAAQLTFTAQ